MNHGVDTFFLSVEAFGFPSKQLLQSAVSSAQKQDMSPRIFILGRDQNAEGCRPEGASRRLNECLGFVGSLGMVSKEQKVGISCVGWHHIPCWGGTEAIAKGVALT